MTKSLHHLLITDHLIDQCRLFPSRLRLQSEHGKCFLCNKGGHDHRHRRDQKHNQRDPYIDTQHESDGSHNREHTRK